MSVALAGLFVVTIAAPASADDRATSFGRNQAHYDGTEQTSKYFPTQKVEGLYAKLGTDYSSCQEALSELGWNDPERYYYCSWRHNHYRNYGGRPGKAIMVTGFSMDRTKMGY
jgi:hypothetical protein